MHNPAIKLAEVAQNQYEKTKNPDDNKIVTLENTINTRFPFGMLEDAKNLGVLLKPKGTNRYYVNLS